VGYFTEQVQITTMALKPCASTEEVGAIFDNFLGRTHAFTSQPDFVNPPLKPQEQGHREEPLTQKQLPESPAVREPIACLPKKPSSKRKRLKTEQDSSSNSGSDSVDLKVARRRKQNRVAAQTSREKKKKYLNGLESQVQDLSDQNQKLQAQLQAALEENKRLRKAQEGNHNHLSFVKSGPMLPLESQAQPRNLKTEVITTLESAVFVFPQPSEVVMTLLFFLLSLALAVCKAPVALPLYLKSFFRKSLSDLKIASSSWTPATPAPVSIPSTMRLNPTTFWSKRSSRSAHPTFLNRFPSLYDSPAWSIPLLNSPANAA
jgi:regulator of replication initiation timing